MRKLIGLERSRVLRPLFLAVLIAATISGCGSTSDSAANVSGDPTSRHGASRLSVAPAGSSAREFSIAKDDFLELVGSETWRAGSECMAERGFELPARPAAPPATGPLLYGLPSSNDPEIGYSIKPPEGYAPVEMVLDTTPEFLRALHGQIVETMTYQLPAGEEVTVTVSDGCLGEAEVALYGSVAALVEGSRALMFMQALEVNAYVQSEADPAILSLNESWSLCMAEAGFDFPNPLAAWSNDWSDALTGDEIEAARADVHCKAELDYDTVYWSIVDGLFAFALEKNPGLVEQWRDVQAAVAESVGSL